jgi:hypothetical protein
VEDGKTVKCYGVTGVVPLAPVSTVPFVEMFSGVGSASHYLKQWFHPTAAFDSDPAAQAVMAKHFPACAMAADCESILAGGEGTTKFAAAAKSARVAFASPPCSQTSVVNKQRDESSPTAMLSVTVLKLLEYFPFEVFVLESTSGLASALGGRLMAAMFALVAALPIPYVPHLLHIDPPRACLELALALMCGACGSTCRLVTAPPPISDPM